MEAIRKSLTNAPNRRKYARRDFPREDQAAVEIDYLPRRCESTVMHIHQASPNPDSDSIWPILEPTIRAGETYTLSMDMSRADAIAYWFAAQHEVFVVEENNQTLGTYFIQPNHQGGGAHVANCGYITAPWATGRGVARAMCAHSLEHARARGFRAMQFNFVVSTNQRAVALWQSFGFEIVGRLPSAFCLPTKEFVDALVMYRSLM